MLSHKQLVATCLFSSLLTFSVVAEIPTQYVVTQVASNDTLNIRSGAGVTNEIIAAIPFNGTDIQAVGEEQSVGKTVWVKIIWQGKKGWVSKHYLQALPIINDLNEQEPATPVKPEAEKVTPVVQDTPKLLKAVESSETLIKKEVIADYKSDEELESTLQDIELDTAVVDFDSSHNEEETTPKDEQLAGNWILQCGDKKPYWKVQLHPKSLNVFRDKYEESLPITLKKQHKNKWNTALKTIVKGQKGKNSLEMTIKYAYSKRCYDTLSSLVVPYKVTTILNGEKLTGCCHAVQLEDEAKERQISKAP